MEGGEIFESDEVQQHGFLQDLLSLSSEQFYEYLGEWIESVGAVMDAIRDHRDECPDEVQDAAERLARVVLFQGDTS